MGKMANQGDACRLELQTFPLFCSICSQTHTGSLAMALCQWAYTKRDRQVNYLGIEQDRKCAKHAGVWLASWGSGKAWVRCVVVSDGCHSHSHHRETPAWKGDDAKKRKLSDDDEPTQRTTRSSTRLVICCYSLCLHPHSYHRSSQKPAPKQRGRPAKKKK